MDRQFPVTPNYQLQNRIIVLFTTTHHHRNPSRQHNQSNPLHHVRRRYPTTGNRFTQISQYADDIAIWTSHMNPFRTEEYLQQYINSINQWCHDWRLELNPKKSQILYIAKHNRLRRQPYLTLNNAIIPVTNQVRFLGIHIDRGLTLGYQHRLTHRKVKQRFRLLFRIAGTTDNPLASPKYNYEDL
ncbi:hypothetical protein BSL78_11144 [Apostichopus japonicus]|uniref:Reverse transcriptase domain-containing protein n=1 Tax=Stichopus japonicus TaxID=307972 RepID=A0A2G8KV90_STIJA|nr:hypothetical protein BSL78_11144 [Apostichopus japonicus]